MNLRNYESNVEIRNPNPAKRETVEAISMLSGGVASRLERWIGRWCARITGSKLWLFHAPDGEGQGGAGQIERRLSLQAPPSLSEILLRLAVLGLVLFTLAARSHACGPDFPNNLLTGGDEALFAAPVADFQRELARLNLSPSRFPYVAATNGYDQLTLDAEMADLAAALKKSKVSPEDSVLIVEGHQANRSKLSEYREACRKWDSNVWMEADESTRKRSGPPPVFPMFSEVTGLPVEFADYFAGAAEMCHLDTDKAAVRKHWERLLARPVPERKFKSTWAAFMIGKYWEGEDDGKAVEYFQMTRDLAKRGFADSTGLAVAAIGLEARVELRRKHFKRAMELYLEQYAAGDDSAMVSLQWTAAAALNAGGEELVALAASEDTRSVITASLICGRRGSRHDDSDSPAANQVVAWLNAVEAHDVSDVESAERLALAAYQEGEFEIAQRWVKRAKNTPVAQWLQAKLFLRAGKVTEAAALLAKVTESLPVNPAFGTNEVVEFADSLRMARGSDIGNPARNQMLGELGALRLSRRDFVQALDALLHAGFWQDAAYVAERVLTVDELKAYVDRHWPLKLATAAEPAEGEIEDETAVADSRHLDIRYLLARRLTREMRSGEARDYYPAVWQPTFDELVVALDEGWKESAPAEQRAKALFASAYMVRTNGMELLGTELSPDWFINGGSFDRENTWEQRPNAVQSSRVNIASEAELTRAARHRADPEVRYHYRYQAAFLAWEAAKLMPNHSDETARVLCTAGTWLKRRDPATADLFYKALVRRCRKTAIGDQADRMRWFPVLDESGNPIPDKLEREESSPPQPDATSAGPLDETMIGVEALENLFKNEADD